MEVPMATNNVLPRGGWFWGWVHMKRPYNTSNRHIELTLANYWRLDRRKCLGIELKWDYQKRTARLSMLHHTKELLIKHNHAVPKKPCNSPHENKLSTCGAKNQCVDDPDESLLNTVEIRNIQAIIGSLLYYGRVVDNKLLVALSSITTKKHSPTTFTLQCASGRRNIAPCQ